MLRHRTQSLTARDVARIRRATADPAHTARTIIAAILTCLGAACLVPWGVPLVMAQDDAAPGWAPGVTLEPPESGWDAQSMPGEPAASADSPSEAVRRAREALQGPDTRTGLSLSAKLTDDGAALTEDIIWRIYEDGAAGQSPPKLVYKVQSATVRHPLAPGRYIVMVSFGRSFLTRAVEVSAGNMTEEVFVLNAGGLRLTAYAADKQLSPEMVKFDIFEAETDQLGERRRIVRSAEPGQVIRLNAGIYLLRSTYGDSNASVESEASVEAGKLTEVAMAHAAARVTLRLVARPGGEAIPATRWTITTPTGELVARSVGALPSHIVAPGTYVVTARNGGREFTREIVLEDAQMADVEVLAQ